jgi:hypothetical protein
MQSTATKLLIVVDGIFRLGRQTDDDNYFTISHLIQTLRTRRGPNPSRLVAIDTAHREGLDDPNATIKLPFRFAPGVGTGVTTSTVNLSAYDEIWLFGYTGVNPVPNEPITWDPNWAYLGDDELAALTTFMNRGGGILAAGDHASLGAVLCGRIPRVRTMRRW